MGTESVEGGRSKKNIYTSVKEIEVLGNFRLVSSQSDRKERINEGKKDGTGQCGRPNRMSVIFQ
jgi:hypothetical protein